MIYFIDDFSIKSFHMDNFTNYLIRIQKTNINEIKFLMNNIDFHIKNENVANFLSNVLNKNIRVKHEKFKFSNNYEDRLFAAYVPKEKLIANELLTENDVAFYRIIPTFEAPLWDREAVEKRDEELSKLEHLITERDL